VKTYAIGVLVGLIALITGIVLIAKLVPAEWQNGLITGIVILAAVIGVITLIVKLKGSTKPAQKSGSADPIVIKMVKPTKARDWFWAHALLWVGVCVLAVFLVLYYFVPGLFYQFFGMEQEKEVKAGIKSPTVQIEVQDPVVDQIIKKGKVYRVTVQAPVLIKLFDYTEPVMLKVLNEQKRGEWMVAMPEMAGKVFYFGRDKSGKLDQKTTTFLLKPVKETHIRVFEYSS